MLFLQKCFHWTCAYRNIGDDKYKIVPNPAWGWCADPFLVEYKSEIYLFAEAFLYKSERNGVIACCKYNGKGFDEWQVCMDEHWHFSYPNVFVENGELYMCPETYQNETVSLYKLKQFPNKWERVNVLLDNVRFVDTTFLKYKGVSYMFTFASKFKESEGDLLLYKYNGKKYCKIAKITDDKTNARPAGNFFEEKGMLIRPAQNSEHSYGEGLVLMCVDSIFPEYKEHEIKKIYPCDVQIDGINKYCGIHTYNRCAGMEVIDLKYGVVSLAEAFARRRVRKVFVNKY